MAVVGKEVLVGAVALKAGLKKAEADRAIEAFVDAVAEALKRGDSVRIPGFGSFVVRQRGPRKVKAIKTKQLVEVPARKYVAFKPGKSLRID